MKKIILLSAVCFLYIGSYLNAQIVTQTFNFAGANQTFTIPSGVTSIDFDVQGARGGTGTGSFASGAGGLGGRVVGTISVTPGSILNIFVGGTPSPISAGGFNGGGTGGVASLNTSGGGGGASDIRIGGTALADRVIVAGGGGGSAQGFGGVGGGLTGGSGSNLGTGTIVATGGTQVTGGSGGLYTTGTCAPGFFAPNGILGTGGNGVLGTGTPCINLYGGGGGGGWYGGGGMQVNGAGGGSSFTSPSATGVVHTQGFRSGNGVVTITYSNPAAALNYDGSNDYVNAALPPVFTNIATSDFTVEAWVNPSGSTVSRVMYAQFNLTNYATILMSASRNIYFYVVDGGSLFSVATSSVLPLNTWTHVAVRWTASSNTPEILFNGVVQATAGGGSSSTGTNNTFTIGSRTDGAQQVFPGSIDEVRVWSLKRTDFEISSNMNCEIPGIQTGLQANYHFNHGTAGGNNAGITTLTDYSGNANNGTLNNFALTGSTSNWIAPGGVSTGNSCCQVLPVITGSTTFCSGSSTQICGTTGMSSYLWSTGATTQCITVSTANIFTVTVTDGNGCTGSTSVTTTVNPLPACSITGGNFCNGSSTQLCAATNSGYLWSTGATTQCITVSAGGTYTVTVTNGNGCTSSCSKTVIAYTPPTCSITGSFFYCQGGSTQICAPAGLVYIWNTGATTQCITVTANDYTVTVTDANGCSSSCSATVTQRPNPNCAITGNGSVCSGSSAQWCAASAPVGYTYTYLWGTGATTQCITVSTANTYTVTTTDQYGCTSSCSKTLTVNPLPACSITGGNFCNGSSTQLCAATNSGYLWSTGATTQCITVSAGGTYTVTVTNGNGCTSSCSKTVIAYTPPTCSITGSFFYCQGGSTQICAPAGLVYIWNTGATTQCITVTANDYTVTVTDANGCSSSCSATVTQRPNPNCAITGNGSVCSGSSAQWCAASAPVGYTYTYLWGTGATTQCITVSTANTYTVTTTDQYGCTSSCSKTLTVNPNPTPSISGTLSFCSGSSTQICATTSSSYLWSTGATTQCITVNSANTFTVTVTNAFGCSGSTSATTTVIPLPTISTTGPLSLNNNPGFCSATVSNAQLMAQVTSITGTPPPTVTFSPPAGSFPVGTTLVTATATNTCGAPTSSFNVTVIDNENPTITCPPTVTVNTDPGVCYATNINFGTPLYGDNCTGATVANNALAQYPSGQFPQGGIIVQWEATDASGNKSSCSQTVAIQDIEPPVALCKNICIYLNSAGAATITGADIDNGSNDNCGIQSLTPSQTSFSFTDAGPNTITLTVLDINGNSSTCTATVTVGEYYTLFGADNNCVPPTGSNSGCRVTIGNGNTVAGNVGSYRLITTGGGVVINGNVISGGKVNYANGVASKSVSAANSLGQPGIIFGTGNSATITGDVNVTGNININQNAGSFVTGIVRHPVGTTYSGPLPGGGVLLAPAVIPALPGMPAINSYSCGGANITTSAILNPGSYGDITLGNPAGVVITFHGPGNYYFSRISMGQGGIHTFKFDFMGLPGKINIFVCGDINFGTFMTQWANPNTPDACRVYYETHGTGSTNGTNSVQAAVIGLGSQFYGRIWAPYGGIKIGSGSCCTYATGSFWSAKQVHLEGAVTINRCGSTCPPGPRIGQEGTIVENTKDMLQVYPNPTTGQTTVSFFTETPDNYSLKVMDYQGRVVLNNQIKSIAGDNTLEVDMSQFAKGLYMIEVGNTDHSQKVKLVVQ